MSRPPTSLLGICGLIIWLLVYPVTGLARNYRINAGHLPLYAETKDRGVLIDVIKAKDEEYAAGRLIIEVYAFKRSIHHVAQGTADLHFPIVGSPNRGLKKMALASSRCERAGCGALSGKARG